MNNCSIMIVGVGGQGSLLASKLLGKLFLTRGLDVKVSEVHGMSQRGGSVVTHVRCGGRVYSPITDKGGADFIVSFELLEGARAVEYLKNDGRLITNTQRINPMPVITGTAVYPENLVAAIKGAGINIDAIDALAPAREAGSPKAVNLVLLGRLSEYFDFTPAEWKTVIEQSVPHDFIEINERAFELGAEAKTL